MSREKQLQISGFRIELDFISNRKRSETAQSETVIVSPTHTIFKFSAAIGQRYIVAINAIFDNDSEEFPILEVQGTPNHRQISDIEITEMSPYYAVIQIDNPDDPWVQG